MLLLKYPVPEAANGPQTFVEDAIFLRNNMSVSGGAKIIAKYSGRVPEDPSTVLRPTPPRVSSHLLEQSHSRRRSPLPSPASFLKQQGGVEAILNSAAKGIMDRGERLGVNQALRDAAGEVRKNLQGLSPSPSVSRRTSENQAWRIDDRRQPPASKALVALEAHNRKLAELLSDVTDALYSSVSKDGEVNEPVSVAIRQLGLIKDCLNNSKLPLPALSPLSQSHKWPDSTTKIVAPPIPSRDGADEVLQDPSSFDLEDYDRESADRKISERRDSQRIANDLERSLPDINISSSVGQGDGSSSPTRSEPEVGHPNPARSPAIIPTRSTLAQSSFAWMLEPCTEPNSATSLSPSTTTPFAASGMKAVLRHGREKSSFLFGDEPESGDAAGASTKDPLNGFSLEPMKK